MTKTVRPEEGGIKRLYQAWASFPYFSSEFREWYNGAHAPIGNPCRSAKECQNILNVWVKRNEKKIAKMNDEVVKRGGYGSDGCRVYYCVYQIWPMTSRSPWNTGMFSSICEDPFLGD